MVAVGRGVPTVLTPPLAEAPADAPGNSDLAPGHNKPDGEKAANPDDRLKPVRQNDGDTSAGHDKKSKPRD